MRQLFNLKSYFTFLSRNKVYTAINVFGLSISLMFVLLIGVYTWQEKSVDRQHSKGDRIYAMGLDFYEDHEKELGFHHAILSRFRKNYPEIENTCGFVVSDMRLQKGDEFYKTTVLETDSTFFSMFDFKLLQGDRQTCLNDRNNVVVTKRFANKWFGTEEVLGREITWNDSIRYHVTGVVEDFDNTLINKNVEMIIDFSWEWYHNTANMDEYFPKAVNFSGASIFLQVRKGAKMMGREKEFGKFIHSFWPDFDKAPFHCRPFLVPLNKIYFSGYESYNDNLRTGNCRLVNLLFIVGLVVLLFAIMNYINLTVAQSGYRAREMAARRLFGAKRKHIILRLMIESSTLCFISLLVAVSLALAFAPMTGRLLSTTMDMRVLATPAVIGLLLAFTLLVGFISGIFPAYVLSKAKPIEVVRGTFRHRTKMVLGRVFIVVQNIITIVMLACATIMSLQMLHLVNAPLGFNTKNLICLYQGEAFSSTDFPVFLNKVKQVSGVKLVSCSDGTPQDGGNNNTVTGKDKVYSFQMLIGDPNYLKVYGLSLKHDNHVGHRPVIYLNDQAVGDLKMKPTDSHMSDFYKQTKFYLFPEEAAFGGILNDFRLRNITETEVYPLLLCIKDKVENPWNVTIQFEGNPAKTYKEIQRIYKEVFHEELNQAHPFVDKSIESVFESELRLSKIIALFAFIAIVISLLGLVAMSTYFIQQRSKEIAIRKVFGSTSNRIRRDLIRTFLQYVAIAFIISVPVIWYIINEWISRYSYRIVWWPWIIIAGILVLLISFCAVAVQSYMASNENPVNNIKQE